MNKNQEKINGRDKKARYMYATGNSTYAWRGEYCSKPALDLEQRIQEGKPLRYLAKF